MEWKRNSLFFVFLVLVIGMIVFVLASAPSWNGAPEVNYTTLEGSIYYHNFSANITGFDNDVEFEIAPTESQRLYWTNASGTFNFTSADIVSEWILMTNISSGNLTINATYDNQTGFFQIPIKATNITGSPAATTEVFEFMINVTNDAPSFTNTVFEHNWSVVSDTNYSVSLLDEEQHYPLNFTMISTNCSYGSATGRVDDVDCDSPFSIVNISNTSAEVRFNYAEDRVGVYWFNLSVSESDHSCPHEYCDSSTYDQNIIVNKFVKFEVQPALVVNVSNCTNQIINEDEEFNCTVNVTTVQEIGSVNLSSLAFFRSGAGYVGNSSWFYSNSTLSSTDFVLSIPISIVPTKNKVGNWTINFSASDDSSSTVSQLNLYVNFTENITVLDTINDVDVYEDTSVLVNATDEDLLIQDSTVKTEDLTFDSNWSTDYVTITESTEDHTKQYVTANISINYDAFYALDASGGNYSIFVNVTDSVGNVDSQIFVAQVLTNVPPAWNFSGVASFPSNENDTVYINLSDGYTSDSDEDSLTFYYSNDTRFDNFNLTSEGIVNFTSSDVDVGQHLVTIIVSDGKQNISRIFNFTVNNLADNTKIYSLRGENSTAEYTLISGFNMTAREDVYVNFTLEINDDDFLIPDYQVNQGFYNESLNIDVIATNSTGSNVDLFEFVFNSESSAGIYNVQYKGAFIPAGSQVDYYTIFVNITDGAGYSINRSFFLNITSANDAPVLDTIENVSLTVNDVLTLDVNATDEEDGNDSVGALTYNVTFVSGTDFINGNLSAFNITTGVFDVDLSSLVGEYSINISVNDSLGNSDWQVFGLKVYGAPNITDPESSYVFNWTEGVAIDNVNFNVSYAVNNTNLTYRFYLDRIIYSNSTDFNYTDLIGSSSLRNETNFTLTDEINLTWGFTPNYTDESYDMLKNLTLVVYNPDYPELNDSVNWKVNVTHVNQNVSFTGISIPDKGPVSSGTSIEINLSQYFEDSDYWDNKYNQVVNFTMTTVSGSGVIAAFSSQSGWIYTLSSPTAVSEILQIVAHEYNSSNVEIGNATSDPFTVEFVAPTTVSTPARGGGTTTLKHFSLKLIVPQDIIISDEGFISIPFSVQNNGQTDLRGISLNSYVRFDDAFSDDVKISLGDDSIDFLGIGDSQNFTMKISANTQRAGKYKATIFANVTSPKFSDFADFFIEIKKANESEAEQILVFTEKFIADNPECLELTETLNLAEEAFLRGEYINSLKLAKQVTEACEDAISANEQVKYKVKGFVQDNFSYIFFATFGVFFAGFLFYVYKRVRFNKSRVDEYV